MLQEASGVRDELGTFSDALLAFASERDVPHLVGVVARRIGAAIGGTCVVTLGSDLECRDVEAVVPLRARDRLIGSLVLARADDARPLDARELALVRMLADHAALAIASAQLLADTKREHQKLAERLRVLADVSREFSAATDDYHLLLETIARRLGEAIGDMCSIRALSEDGEWFEAAGGAYHRDPALLEATRVVMTTTRQHVTEGLSGRVASTGRAVLTPRVDLAAFTAATEPRYRPYLEQLAVTSSLALPLVSGGKVIGIVHLMRSGPGDPYDDDDLQFAQSVAEHAAFAIASARSRATERAARDAAGKATDAVAKAESRFAQLYESAIIGIVTNNLADGRILDVNDALLGLLGYSRDELLSGRVPWRELTPPEWAAVDAKARAQLLGTGIAGLREKEYLHRDGRRVPVLAGSIMLHGSDNECFSFVLDLTERKTTEAALEHMRREHVADEQRARLAAIVDASADAIVGKTLAGIVTSWNPGAERLFGYAADEIVGRSILLLIPPGREDEESAILQALGEGDVKHFDTVRRRKDGRDIDVSVTSSPVRDTAGRVIGISKVARDITDRKQAEEALARARDAAEAASRELEAFSYSVAHDLRAPLRGMNGFAQLLLESYHAQFDADGRDWLTEIVSNAKRMAELIDALLSLSRVTRSELRRESVDLSAIVRTLGARLAADEPDRAIELVVEDQLRADLDSRLAAALVDNLLRNAWKFTSKVHPARIEFGGRRCDGEHAFYVRDNGAGFDMAFASKLFAPFQRLHARTEFPGTGIGLATAQRIVHRHGGRIWAEGVVDGGATFYFSVPNGPIEELA